MCVCVCVCVCVKAAWLQKQLCMHACRKWRCGVNHCPPREEAQLPTPSLRACAAFVFTFNTNYPCQHAPSSLSSPALCVCVCVCVWGGGVSVLMRARMLCLRERPLRLAAAGKRRGLQGTPLSCPSTHTHTHPPPTRRFGTEPTVC